MEQSDPRGPLRGAADRGADPRSRFRSCARRPCRTRCTTSRTAAASASSRSPRPRSTSTSSTPWRASASRSTWRRGTSTGTSRSASVSTGARLATYTSPDTVHFVVFAAATGELLASMCMVGPPPARFRCAGRDSQPAAAPGRGAVRLGALRSAGAHRGHPGRADARIRSAGQEPPPPGCGAARGDRAHPGADASGDRSVGHAPSTWWSGSSSRPACSATSSSSTSRSWCCEAGCRALRRGIRSTPGSSDATATRSRSRSPTSPAPRHASMRSRRRSRCPTRRRFSRSLR